MFNILKKIAIIDRAQDEILYEYVLDEMEQGVRIKGLWAKALAHSDGSDSKAESIYMQYRVQSIKDQFDALKIAYDEMSRKRLFDYIKNGFKDPVLEEKKAKAQIESKARLEREAQQEIEAIERISKESSSQKVDKDEYISEISKLEARAKDSTGVHQAGRRMGKIVLAVWALLFIIVFVGVLSKIFG